MQPSTLISLAVTAFFPGFVEAVLCLPLLLLTRVRELFRSLPPTDSVIISYLLAIVALSGPFIAGVVAAFGLDVWQRPIYDVLTQIASVVSLGYVVVLPVTAIVGLPQYGVDWDSTGYGIGTWVVLILGTLWYVIWFIIPIVFIAGLLALPTG